MATLPREQVPHWRHAAGARYGRPRRADARAHARRHARTVVVVLLQPATRLVLEAERRHVVAHELVGRHAHVQHRVAALQLEVPAVEARARRQHLGGRVDAQRDHLAVEAAELHLQALRGELDPLVRQQAVLVGRLQLLNTAVIAGVLTTVTYHTQHPFKIILFYDIIKTCTFKLYNIATS